MSRRRRRPPIRVEKHHYSLTLQRGPSPTQSLPHKFALSRSSFSQAEQEDNTVSERRPILIQRAILVGDRLLCCQDDTL